MTMYRPRTEKQTTNLDIAYLTILIGTFAVTGVVMFLLEPDSWFHRNKSEAFCLLLGALAVCGVINLAIAGAYGKIWMKTGTVLKTEHPVLFGTYYTMNVIILVAVVVTIVALLFFLPPL